MSWASIGKGFADAEASSGDVWGRGMWLAAEEDCFVGGMMMMMMMMGHIGSCLLPRQNDKCMILRTAYCILRQ